MGRRLTGFAISLDGRVSQPGGKKSRTNERELDDAIFAAVGVFDQEGRRRINPKHADILLHLICDTEDMPTLTDITARLTDYYGSKSKQTPPFALGVVSTWCVSRGRLALHYRLAKSPVLAAPVARGSVIVKGHGVERQGGIVRLPARVGKASPGSHVGDARRISTTEVTASMPTATQLEHCSGRRWRADRRIDKPTPQRRPLWTKDGLARPL